MRRSRKPFRGLCLRRGFESLPLRFRLHKSPGCRDFGQHLLRPDGEPLMRHIRRLSGFARSGAETTVARTVARLSLNLPRGRCQGLHLRPSRANRVRAWPRPILRARLLWRTAPSLALDRPRRSLALRSAGAVPRRPASSSGTESTAPPAPAGSAPATPPSRPRLGRHATESPCERPSRPSVRPRPGARRPRWRSAAAL